ncbi:arogenate dehydrogenase [Pleurocapsa sp. CCALA 161]|uniref:prephenate/arogenate dehydrogenase n=1 Tax=Pleurocapsa sp. CCALA 161 TaxID=2107688 RepID=UPI000D0753CB|nr:prephenate/arogenate dehydrogenase [Pleurocapsa sp. CCALA 161]PSB08416.1 arogenate dehydrogenase [Pleurocapsa sp. CCALA 161]
MKIGIVGLGLIGGSLAIDLRSQGHKIYGVSRQLKTCQIALEKGIADYASPEFKILAETEIVFICTPIATIASTIKQLIPYINPKTIITDVGSVKQPIVAECSQLWSNFIGGHPMAGTTQSGIDAAVANLFTGAAYVFTPTDQSKPENIAKLTAIASELSAIPYVCDAQIHDRAVSWISHLPVMVSASLIKACLTEEPDTFKLAQILASSGFRDTSRVGGGNAELGVMIAKYNQQELLRSLLQYRQNLDEIIALIQQEDWQSLEQTLQITSAARPKFLN